MQIGNVFKGVLVGHIPVSIALLVDYSKVQNLRVMLATFFFFFSNLTLSSLSLQGKQASLVKAQLSQAHSIYTPRLIRDCISSYV